MTKNILLVLNTNFHFETVLSLYKTVQLQGYVPTILLDYSYYNPSDYTLYDYGSEEFLKKNNLQYIKKEDYTHNFKDIFYKAIVISSSEFLNTLELNKHIIEDFNDKIILIFHRANYREQFDFCKTIFKEPKAVSVTNFSQKYNLPFLFQIENPIIQYNKLQINNPIEFLILGRFCWPNRSLNYIDEIISLDAPLNKKIKISIVGQKPFDEKEIESFKQKELTNITIETQYNISEIDFYEKIYKTDYILNLIDYKRGFYFIDRFSSNFTHTIAFNKPSLCFMPLNLIYNIPCVEYTAQDFKEKFLQCVNTDDATYTQMVNNFDEIKNNMRNHNTNILNDLLN